MLGAQFEHFDLNRAGGVGAVVKAGCVLVPVVTIGGVTVGGGLVNADEAII
jgi:hypothetical protein